MRALTWHGKHDVRIETVPDPEIVNPRDAVIEVTATAICGSDLHLYDGVIPGLKAGDILGHEFMGRVVETGPRSTLKKGQRVVVPFTISCGACFFCKKKLFSACDNSNPVDKQDLTEPLYGHAMAGLFGYSHLTGGYAGGQAEYVRVPFADVGPLKIESDLSDEQVLFLSDILPTAYMGAENCDISPGDVVAVWGAGPVGQLAMVCARLLGADRIIAIDRFEHRLAVARQQSGAETINFEDVDVNQCLKELTGGRGPDACIDAVGMEAHHGNSLIHAYDRVKQATRLESDRPHVLRQAITSCRNGGVVSVVGVYGGFVDKFPMGSLMNRGLTIRTGQCHVQKYMRPLLQHIEAGRIDPTFIISHRMGLDEAPIGYETFKNKQDECMKVVLRPFT